MYLIFQQVPSEKNNNAMIKKIIGLMLLAVAFPTYAQQASPIAEIDFGVWPKGEPNTGYALYFSGNSYLYGYEPEKGGPHNVTFEPCCRNNWHIHHRATQVLVGVGGRGWVQEWGKDPVEMKEGTVVVIPAGTKHWHGAAKDSWFQHLAIMTNQGENPTNEWLEPVTDEEYFKLK